MTNVISCLPSSTFIKSTIDINVNTNTDDFFNGLNILSDVFLDRVENTDPFGFATRSPSYIKRYTNILQVAADFKNTSETYMAAKVALDSAQTAAAIYISHFPTNFEPTFDAGDPLLGLAESYGATQDDLNTIFEKIQRQDNNWKNIVWAKRGFYNEYVGKANNVGTRYTYTDYQNAIAAWVEDQNELYNDSKKFYGQTDDHRSFLTGGIALSATGNIVDVNTFDNTNANVLRFGTFRISRAEVTTLGFSAPGTGVGEYVYANIFSSTGNYPVNTSPSFTLQGTYLMRYSDDDGTNFAYIMPVIDSSSTVSVFTGGSAGANMTLESYLETGTNVYDTTGVNNAFYYQDAMFIYDTFVAGYDNTIAFYHNTFLQDETDYPDYCYVRKLYNGFDKTVITDRIDVYHEYLDVAFASYQLSRDLTQEGSAYTAKFNNFDFVTPSVPKTSYSAEIGNDPASTLEVDPERRGVTLGNWDSLTFTSADLGIRHITSYPTPTTATDIAIDTSGRTFLNVLTGYLTQTQSNNENIFGYVATNATSDESSQFGRYGNVYACHCSKGSLLEGTMASGLFFDISHSSESIEADIQGAICVTLNSDNSRVSLDEFGLDLIGNSILTVLETYQTSGVIDRDFRDNNGVLQVGYTLNVPTVQEITSANRQNRSFPCFTFEYRLGGALHSACINGEANVSIGN